MKKKSRPPRSTTTLKQAVLAEKMPAPTKRQILEFFKKEGIASLSDLADRLAEAEASKRAALPAMRRIDSKVESEILKALASKRAPRTEHVIPKVNFVVGDNEYSPNDISKFDGQYLHFVLIRDPKDLKKPALLAFKDFGEVIAHGNKTHFGETLWRIKGAIDREMRPLDYDCDGSSGFYGASDRFGFPCDPCSDPYWRQIYDDICNPKPPVPPRAQESAQHFQDISLGGAWFWTDRWQMHDDLYQVTRPGGGFLGLGTETWDNDISSLGPCLYKTLYFEHPFKMGCGNSLSVPPYSTIYDLRPLGWNDRISSTVNWGY